MIIQTLKLAGDRSSQVYLYKTDSGEYIVAVPDIHWSAKFDQLDELSDQFHHLQSSLNFHMFEGNTDKLAKDIMEMVRSMEQLQEIK
ncbi:YueH family protein [Metabacillus mangrovi]|uniref:YueH family protein n=1 Tax=Metabacillus mangrovi TaxID=1491830 RepID=UPI0012BA619A|nr:YueH family protein [Metabacillus mangrovi]